LKIKFKKLHPNAVKPTYAKDGDAGLDLTAVEINDRNKYFEIKYGIAVEIPKGYFGFIVTRSSITNVNLMKKNGIGLIDSGFRGEIVSRFKKVKFEDGTQEKLYTVGERTAQLLIMPFPYIEMEEVEILSETQRGDGGFGSTNCS